MYQLVLCVLPDVETCASVLEGWNDAGVSGVTILESSGLGQLRETLGLQAIQLVPRLSDFDRARELRHRTLFAVVESDELIDRLVAATEAVVGPLNEPHTGIIVVLPVARVVGLPRKSSD